jgi:hypothetical protein
MVAPFTVLPSHKFVGRDDILLTENRRDIIISSARCLDDARMIRFQETTGYLNSTDTVL